MQDSYLLVVALRQGASAQNSTQLRDHCAQQVEAVRQALEKAGMSQRNIEHISYAQCALLDETMLNHAREEAHAKWAGEPLQARFFSRHQAGESLYEDMREVLREPAPDPHVLTVFHRVLMLGFQGCYHDLDDPERERLLAALDAQVVPLTVAHELVTRVGIVRRIRLAAGLQTPLLHALAVGLLLFATWWGLDQWLGGMVSMLLPAQG
ncbi:type VI secretion system protein TssL, short form [Pseudomonas asplenii]|nr:type VI secretion system protein TssL, short form [Pseudomonas fuscovaginae]